MTQQWLTPAQAAPLLGLHPKTVRDMCAARRIDCRVTFGPKGQARYQLSADHLRAFNLRHTQRATN